MPTVGNIAGMEATSTVSPASKVPPPVDNVSPAPEFPEDIPVRTGPPAVPPETPCTGPPDVPPETLYQPVARNQVLPATATPFSITAAPVNPPDAPTIAAAKDAPTIAAAKVPATPAPVVVNAGVAATESTYEIFLEDPDKDDANKKDAAPAAAAYHPGFVSLRHFFSVEVTTN